MRDTDWLSGCDHVLSVVKQYEYKQRNSHLFTYLFVWYIGIFSLVLGSYKEIPIVLIS